MDITWLNFLATSVTAAATVALVWATAVLARVTRQMNEATTSPNIVVTVLPSRWSSVHLNQKILNSGAGPAFDVKILVEAVDQEGNVKAIPQKRWSDIDVLAPGQQLDSHMGSTAELNRAKFHISISWSLAPSAKKRFSRKYVIDTSSWDSIALEAGGDPLIQIAQETKGLQEDFRRVLSGSRRLKVDNFSNEDRAREVERMREIRDEHRATAGNAEEGRE